MHENKNVLFGLNLRLGLGIGLVVWLVLRLGLKSDFVAVLVSDYPAELPPVHESLSGEFSITMIITNNQYL